MQDHTSDPNTEQITIWRNLLDSFGQLSAAWEAAAEAQQAAEAGKGPAALQLPESLVASFSRAGTEVADALSGVATVLAHQSTQDDWFNETAEATRTARDKWNRSHEEVREESGSAGSPNSSGNSGSSGSSEQTADSKQAGSSEQDAPGPPKAAGPAEPTESGGTPEPPD